MFVAVLSANESILDEGFHRNFQETCAHICVNMFIAVLSANESILYEGIPPQLSGKCCPNLC